MERTSETNLYRNLWKYFSKIEFAIVKKASVYRCLFHFICFISQFTADQFFSL